MKTINHNGTAFLFVVLAFSACLSDMAFSRVVKGITFTDAPPNDLGYQQQKCSLCSQILYSGTEEAPDNKVLDLHARFHSQPSSVERLILGVLTFYIDLPIDSESGVCDQCGTGEMKNRMPSHRCAPHHDDSYSVTTSTTLGSSLYSGSTTPTSVSYQPGNTSSWIHSQSLTHMTDSLSLMDEETSSVITDSTLPVTEPHITPFFTPSTTVYSPFTSSAITTPSATMTQPVPLQTAVPLAVPAYALQNQTVRIAVHPGVGQPVVHVLCQRVPAALQGTYEWQCSLAEGGAEKVSAAVLANLPGCTLSELQIIGPGSYQHGFKNPMKAADIRYSHLSCWVNEFGTIITLPLDYNWQTINDQLQHDIHDRAKRHHKRQGHIYAFVNPSDVSSGDYGPAMPNNLVGLARTSNASTIVTHGNTLRCFGPLDTDITKVPSYTLLNHQINSHYYLQVALGSCAVFIPGMNKSCLFTSLAPSQMDDHKDKGNTKGQQPRFRMCFEDNPGSIFTPSWGDLKPGEFWNTCLCSSTGPGNIPNLFFKCQGQLREQKHARYPDELFMVPHPHLPTAQEKNIGKPASNPLHIDAILPSTDGLYLVAFYSGKACIYDISSQRWLAEEVIHPCVVPVNDWSICAFE
ncbi:hypothetical protein [Spongorhabdus nitratireducens]